MRKTYLTLLALGCAVLPAWGQPAAPANDKQLDAYLQRWEEAMKSVKSLAISCERIETDKVYNTKKIFEGTIHFEKPTKFIWHMAIKGKQTEYERFICTGTYLYQFLPAQKQIKVYPAPKTNTEGKLAEDTSLAFLFGMKAAEAKARYDLKLLKVDDHYVYVNVTSRAAVDKADFLDARIVLNKDSFLPRQLWFKHPNGGEVTWDLKAVQSNVNIPVGAFVAPQKPTKDWEMVQSQTQPQPRIIRQQKP